LLLELVDLERKKGGGNPQSLLLAKDYDVFQFQFSTTADSEIIAQARYNEHNMLVDLRLGEPGCPAKINQEFSSLNAWALACKGRAVSVKPYIFFQGLSLRAHEDRALAINPKSPKSAPSSKLPAKLPAKSLAKSPAKSPAKSLAKSPAISIAKTTAKCPAKSPRSSRRSVGDEAASSLADVKNIIDVHVNKRKSPTAEEGSAGGREVKKKDELTATTRTRRSPPSAAGLATKIDVKREKITPEVVEKSPNKKTIDKSDKDAAKRGKRKDEGEGGGGGKRQKNGKGRKGKCLEPYFFLCM